MQLQIGDRMTDRRGGAIYRKGTFRVDMSNSHSDFFIKNDLEACEKVNNIYGHACRPPIMCTNPVAGLCMDYESVQRDMQRRPAEMQHIKRRSKAWSSGSSGPLSQTRPKIPVIDEHG
jgi:hypothetical protein